MPDYRVVRNFHVVPLLTRRGLFASQPGTVSARIRNSPSNFHLNSSARRRQADQVVEDVAYSGGDETEVAFAWPQVRPGAGHVLSQPLAVRVRHLPVLVALPDCGRRHYLTIKREAPLVQEDLLIVVPSGYAAAHPGP